MPVHKFRAVEDMPSPAAEASTERLAERIRTLWNRAFLLAPRSIPRGVTRFATIEAANAHRAAHIAERMRESARSPR